VSACSQVQQGNPDGPLVTWVQGERALPVAERDPGRERRAAGRSVQVTAPELAPR